VDRSWIRTAVGTAAVVAATSSACGLPVNTPGDPTVAHVRVAVPGTGTAGETSNPSWPSSIGNRKILDQYGDVYLMRTFSSWSLTDRSDAEITASLQGLAASGFNAVTVWAGGGYGVNGTWDSKYDRKANGDKWWGGTAWQSSLGPAWKAMDHVVVEARRLGMAVNFSFCGGFGDTGAGPDWEAASSTQMRNAGIAIANRYPAADYPNIVWHVMLDDGHALDSIRGQRINALFEGINDTEGQSTRPVRWLEPANGSSIAGQGWLGTGDFNASMNGWYSYAANSAEIVEASYREDLTVPTGDTEPPYDGSPHYPGDLGQQLRERSWATFIEGGAYINYGHEDWWPFGKEGLFTENVFWTDVPTHSHTIEQSYIWPVVDEYVADHAWEPDDARFLKTGTGSGDTKAAAGRSDNAAIAYVPTSRPVVVDTTVIAGTDPVQLRWYDPTTGRYSVVAKSEAQQANRSVPYPLSHPDGSSDWALVVDLATPTVVPSTTTVAPTTVAPTTVPPSTVDPPTTVAPTTAASSTSTSTPSTTTSSTTASTTSTSSTTSTTSTPSTTTPSTTSTTVPSSVPTVPRSLAASSGDRAVRLTWLAPASNGGAAISDYVVQRSADGGRTWRTMTDGVSSARAATVGGLTNGARYGFRVVAVNRVGRGPWSTPASAVPATVSSAPRQLSATRAYRAAKLTWLAPWSNGGAAIRDYIVQRSADGGRTWRTVRDGVSTKRAATAYGITSGGRYRFRVSAQNRIGRGPWSTVVRVAQT
jgi:hypothetical protein